MLHTLGVCYVTSRTYVQDFVSILVLAVLDVIEIRRLFMQGAVKDMLDSDSILPYH